MPSRLSISTDQFDAMHADWWNGFVRRTVRTLMPNFCAKLSDDALNAILTPPIAFAGKFGVESEQAHIQMICVSLRNGTSFFETPAFAASIKAHDNSIDDAVAEAFETLDDKPAAQQEKAPA